ncbi:THC0290_0291 family protein [Dokdonia sp. Hel_I_53]|uniref:THC0290_0291 family protein n=1 Tax=Dokdonia sp. Hel_I_53 TaxID=1566287 RepID=UPI00119A67DA|nr:glutamate dehydrogenase [Dokdonia sp. Hel_I_53]TVZ52782.1 hypothetical protein OD90_1966 [Dokdonia sp. Hel_I_53]
MKAKYLLLALLSFVIAQQSLQAQFGFSHEVGVIAGPVAFQSDYGQRNDFETNSGNVGYGLGIVHYLNFAYNADCNCYSRYTYFNDHFKVRNEIDYHVTNFEHFGDEVGEDSFGGLQLASHKGMTRVFEIGSQLEYFPLSIRDFAAGAYKFTPYISLGVHFVAYDPDAFSELGSGDIFGQITNPYTTPVSSGPALFNGFAQGDGEFNSGIDRRAGDTWAVTWSVGTRYKLDILSDLLLDLRWHYYTSNWVDGLNPDPRPANRADDWIFWINLGYIYYLN